ncbi:hypothetical protein D9M71_636040 [compost metagenome]
MAAQQARRGEAKALAGSSQRMQMIGVVTTEADQAWGIAGLGVKQMMTKLEPFVAADQGIDQVETQDGDLDAGRLKPGQVQALQRSARKIEEVGRHDATPDTSAPV